MGERAAAVDAVDTPSTSAGVVARGKPTSRSRCSPPESSRGDSRRPITRRRLHERICRRSCTCTRRILDLGAGARRAGGRRRRGERAVAPAARQRGDDLRCDGIRGRRLVSVGAPALRVRAAFYPLEVGGVIALYNLTDMLLFGAFLMLAFAYRNRPELHKRWIIAATAALCGAALGRVVPGNTPQYLSIVAVASARDDRR